jgi:hypothetical protein
MMDDGRWMMDDGRWMMDDGSIYYLWNNRKACTWYTVTVINYPLSTINYPSSINTPKKYP